MLRTNTRKVRNRIVNHIWDHAEPTTLLGDIEAGAWPEDVTFEQKCKRYIETGGFLVYYDSMRNEIKDWLEETDEEANRYTDQQVYNLYCHLIIRELVRLYR